MSIWSEHSSWRTGRPVRRRAIHAIVARHGLTLLEIMVAVTLLAAIMIGLLAMFNQTQKALHIANAQTDVFENARGALQMISRDLAEMTTYPDRSIWGAIVNSSESPLGPITLLATRQTNFFTDAFWITRVNDDWQGLGYFVADDPSIRGNFGVGTLYRFSTNRLDRLGVSFNQVSNMIEMFTNALPSQSNIIHRVADGIVHFTTTAIFVETNRIRGRTETNFVPYGSFVVGDVLPAFVDVEIGVLEPVTLKQFQSLKSLDLPAAQNFLANHAEKIHFFRERVPIRNFANPYRLNELP